jgi:hypothetical protein
MGHQQSGRVHAALVQGRAEASQSGSGVKDNVAAIKMDLNATCIAAVNDVTWGRTGNASPNAPELDPTRHYFNPASPTYFSVSRRPDQGGRYPEQGYVRTEKPSTLF